MERGGGKPGIPTEQGKNAGGPMTPAADLSAGVVSSKTHGTLRDNGRCAPAASEAVDSVKSGKDEGKYASDASSEGPVTLEESESCRIEGLRKEVKRLLELKPEDLTFEKFVLRYIVLCEVFRLYPQLFDSQDSDRATSERVDEATKSDDGSLASITAVNKANGSSSSAGETTNISPSTSLKATSAADVSAVEHISPPPTPLTTVKATLSNDASQENGYMRNQHKPQYIRLGGDHYAPKTFLSELRIQVTIKKDGTVEFRDGDTQKYTDAHLQGASAEPGIGRTTSPPPFL